MTRAKTRTIGKLLQATRIELRFTQDDFATELGISRRTLSRWEGGEITLGATDLAWFVSTVHGFAPAIGVRVAGELGLARPGPSTDDMQRALWAAADALNVSAEPMRAVLATLVQTWRARGWTLEQAAAFLEEKGPGGKGKK